MYENSQANLADIRTLDIETRTETMDDQRIACAGWWILPIAVLGALSWVGLFKLVF